MGSHNGISTYKKRGNHMQYAVLDIKATGARIRELRKAAHLTVDQVALYMGFGTGQAIYKWQRGDCMPTVDNLYALSRLFHTTVDDILRGSADEDDKSSPPWDDPLQKTAA